MVLIREKKSFILANVNHFGPQHFSLLSLFQEKTLDVEFEKYEYFMSYAVQIRT